MFNKKIVLSMLIMGFVGMAVASGTWAIYQNTVNTNGNEIHFAPWSITIQAGDPGKSLNTVYVDPEGYSIIPVNKLPPTVVPVQTTNPTILKEIHFINSGIPATVTVTGAPENGASVPAGMLIYIGDQLLYDGTGWKNPTIDLPVGSITKPYTDASVSINFDTTTITNSYSNKKFGFDLTFDVSPNLTP
jgi:hypothetical protein